MGLRIRTIARLTGIREATLRAWERRYGFPVPNRASNNYRTYSREDAEAIRRVARMLEQGYTASEAISLVRTTPTDALPERQRLEERFWSAVMVLDATAVQQALEEADRLMPPASFCDEFLMPLLRKMTARLDVAREHLASAAIRQTMRDLLHRVEAQGGGPGIVLACPPEDQHEGGLLALALHLRLKGWRVMVLGADTPVEAMSAAVEAGRASFLAVSFVRNQPAHALIRRVGEILAAVPVPVLVGGPAIRECLREVMAAGAWFGDSADDVVAIARRLGIVPAN